MRVYIAGPIHSPVPVPKDVLKRRFFTLSSYLSMTMNWSPVNPLEVPPGCEGGCLDRSGLPTGEGHAWECWMKGDLREMLTCEAIVTLPYFEASNGASLEHEIATRLHMPWFKAWPTNERMNPDGSLGWDVVKD